LIEFIMNQSESQRYHYFFVFFSFRVFTTPSF
jgi:hypothetical protein